MHATRYNNAGFHTHPNNTDVLWDPLGAWVKTTSIIHDVITFPVMYGWKKKTTPLKHTYHVHENSLSFTHPALTSTGGMPTLSWDNEIVFLSSAMLQRGGDETIIDTSAKTLTHEEDHLEYQNVVNTSSFTLKRRLPNESNDLNTAAVML